MRNTHWGQVRAIVALIPVIVWFRKSALYILQSQGLLSGDVEIFSLTRCHVIPELDELTHVETYQLRSLPHHPTHCGR